MQYDEFKRLLGKAALTNREFAELTKIHPGTVNNYSTKGTVPNHLAVAAALMGEMAEQKIDFRLTLQKIDFKPTNKGKFGRNK